MTGTRDYYQRSRSRVDPAFTMARKRRRRGKPRATEVARLPDLRLHTAHRSTGHAPAWDAGGPR